MDYLNVGANGFAQVGNEHYFAKSKIEMNYLLKLIKNKFPIPEKLQSLCWFAVKAFQHDFGTYHEIVLHFDDVTIGNGYDEDEPENDIFLSREEINYILDNGLSLPDSPETLHDFFYNWFNNVEAFNLESEEITDAIEAKYLASLNMEKREHLSIAPKRKAS